MTNERRAELMRAMQGESDDQAVLFIVGWGAKEITCGELRALLTSPSAPSGFDLVAHLTRQRAFSERTFGPGQRTAGVLAHIRKELLEIEADPTNLVEWIDVILLAFDGAWRAGHSPAAIAEVLDAKQTKNEARDWPDWRTLPHDVPIEHRRDVDPITAAVNAQLDPLKDQLTAFGHKLARGDGRTFEFENNPLPTFEIDLTKHIRERGDE